MATGFTDEEMGIVPAGGDKRGFTDREMGIVPAPVASPPMPKDRAPTLHERSQSVYGFKEYPKLGDILPFGQTADGQVEIATPQFLRDMLESALLPGHVTQGGSYTSQDALRFGLDFAAPSLKRPPDITPPMTKRRLLETAPSTDELKTAAVSSKAAATASGVVVKPEAENRFLSNIAGIAEGAEVTPGLHDKIVATLKRLMTKAGSEQNVEQLVRQRQLIQDAASSGNAGDRRVAMLMLDEFDDFVDNLKVDDLVSGNAEGVGKNLEDFRSLWTKARKSDAIERIIQDADLQASGFENGLRAGFRSLLKDQRRIRGFSPEERKVMEDIVKGKGANMWRLLGRLSYGLRGNNFLGGAIGQSAGGALAGPAGAMAVPALGHMAASKAERVALEKALQTRAMAATGQVPQNPVIMRLLENKLTKRGGGPTAGTQVETTGQDIDSLLIPGFL